MHQLDTAPLAELTAIRENTTDPFDRAAIDAEIESRHELLKGPIVMEIAERKEQPIAERGELSPMALIQMAINRGATTEQLEKLIALQERVEANQARKAFVAALAAFKNNPPKILKNKLVEFLQTKYRHATLDNVCILIDPALAEYGLSFRWETENLDKGLIRVTCILTHELGHSERTSLQALPDGTGSKNPVQAIGSTVTYLQRYTLLAATGIAVQNTDDDGRGAGKEDRVLTEEQVNELGSALNATKSDWPKFLAFFRIEDLADMKQSDFAKAKEMIDKKRKSK